MIRQAIFVLFISLSISFSAAAQDPKLIEQAKKEGGKLIVYGSLESFTVEPIAEAFQKKTGIAVEYWRASATKVMDRALSETRSGKPLFDVMLNNSATINPADAPKSLEDLLNPKSKGKFVMPDPTQHTTTLQWIASLYKIMG